MVQKSITLYLLFVFYVYKKKQVILGKCYLYEKDECFMEKGKKTGKKVSRTGTKRTDQGKKKVMNRKFKIAPYAFKIAPFGWMDSNEKKTVGIKAEKKEKHKRTQGG